MKKNLKRIAIVLVAAVIILQFFRPAKNQSNTVAAGDFILTEKPAQEVENMLRVACYDCHSNNTRYPWYNNITPVNYYLNNHVKEGKGHLNFSEWTDYPTKRKNRKLGGMLNVLEKNEMPLKSYLLIHKDAKLTEEQVSQLTTWISGLRNKYPQEAASPDQ